MVTFSCICICMCCDVLIVVGKTKQEYFKLCTCRYKYFILQFNFCCSGNTSWLTMDRKVLDHDLPRYADPVIFYFAVRYVVMPILHLFN